MRDNKLLQRYIEAAQGKIECDLIIKNTQVLDVFSCEWKSADLAIIDGVIVGVEPGLKSKRTIDGKNKKVVPGFIDAHVHIESSLLTPENFEKAVLSRGTTTAICDPHELANVMGVLGIEYFLKKSSELSIDLRIMLSSCVPATHFETNGGGHIEVAELLPLLSHPKAIGLAEMMNVPGVLNCDPKILDKLRAFSQVTIDGHCPKVTGLALSAYASAGISSCHESSTLSEAKEKLTKGIATWIREGSVAKDLKALSPILNMATSSSVGFCTDDRNPLDIANEGHIDHLIRTAIQYGVTSEIAYRAASWSVARHYGLKYKGAIAPGYSADIVMLNDATSCSIDRVYKNGVLTSEINSTAHASIDDTEFKNSVKAKTPEPGDFKAPTGRVHVIGVKSGSILTNRFVLGHNDPGVALLSVIERYGHGSKPSNGYVKGFGEKLRGAIASSVGHDSHNLIVVGDTPENMRIAVSALIASGGGFCVVKNGAVSAKLDLPLGGLMSDQEPIAIVKALKKLHKASSDIGCELSEPFLQLAFLSLPVIPSLKLTDKGLVDVEEFKIIDVRAS